MPAGKYLIQLKASLEQNENQRERAKAGAQTGVLRQIDEVKNRANQHACGHEHQHIGQAGLARQQIGQKGQHQQAPQHAEEKRQIQSHAPLRRRDCGGRHRIDAFRARRAARQQLMSR